jgi:toxin secretion/phage lysis holin
VENLQFKLAAAAASPTVSYYSKVAVAVIGSIGTHLFGGWSPLLNLLLTAMLIDWITGSTASALTGKLSSKKGYKGIAKKIMLLAFVAVASIVDRALGEGTLIRDAAIFFYLFNEILSVVENAATMGLPIPPGFDKALAVLKSKSAMGFVSDVITDAINKEDEQEKKGNEQK